MQYILRIVLLSAIMANYAFAADNQFIKSNNSVLQTKQTDYFTQQKAIALAKNENTQQANKVKVIIELVDEPLVKLKSVASRSKKQQSGRAVLAQQQKIAVAQNNVVKLLAKKGINNKYRHKFSSLYNGISLEIDREQLNIVRQLPGIKKVHVVQDKTIHLADSVPLVNADQVWALKDSAEQSITGAGVKVAILDTGVDYTRTELGGCFGEGCRVYTGYDFINGDNDPMDDYGHGTHVAGIVGANGTIKGVAPDASLLAYKVCDYTCPTDGIIAALELAMNPDGDPLTDDGADIINMSLGGPGGLDDPLTVAVNELAQQNVLVVISAGNEGSEKMTISSPGNAELALTVAATDKEDNIANYSSRGPVTADTFHKPEIAAPGSSINSLSIGSGTTVKSGTSMAAPHVAGAAALVKQKYSALTAQEIKSLLVTNTDDIDLPIIEAGSGRLNALSAVEARVVTNQSYVLFERIDRSLDNWEGQAIVELTNISAESITLNLTVDNNNSAITYALDNSDEITLSPGASTSVVIDVSVNIEALSSVEDYFHRQNLKISEGVHESNLPLLFFDAVKLDWSVDSYAESLWVQELSGNASFIIKSQADGASFVPEGDYLVSAFVDYGDRFSVLVKQITDLKSDQEILLSREDAEHQISIGSFVDHLGINQSLDNLYIEGSYVELAHPELLWRQYYFFEDWNQREHLISKPLFVSSFPEGFEFNFSFLAGDKSTVTHDYHAYAHTGSYGQVSSDITIQLDGTSDNQVQFDVTLPEIFNDDFTWNLSNWLSTGNYHTVSGGTYVAKSLRGPNSDMANDEYSVINDAFQLTLHGNNFSHDRFGRYEFEVRSGSDILHSTPYIKFESTGAYKLYAESSYPYKLIKESESPEYRMNGEGRFPYINWVTWRYDYISLFSELRDGLFNDSRDKENTQWLLICDGFVSRDYQVSGMHDYNTEDIYSDCQAKQAELRFTNFLLGERYISSYNTSISNEIKIQSIDATDVLKHNNVANEVIKVSVTLELPYNTEQAEEFNAWINYSGQWQQVATELTTSNLGATWPNTLVYEVSLPAMSEVAVTSLKLSYQEGDESHLRLILPNTYVLGGSEADIMAIDSDNDGIADGIDTDKDNDGIPDDYELINGLNHLDDSDAAGDIDGDGQSNLEEYLAERFISLYEDDSDNDGVADHLDAFPFDSTESVDSDGDGVGNNADSDDDNDGVEDYYDSFPLDATESADTDSDGMGNNQDEDDDNDGVSDAEDAFPLDASESVDTDGDGIGNNADTDDDNDGVSDGNDSHPLDASRSGNTQTNANNYSSSSSGGGGTMFYMIIVLLGLFTRKAMKRE